MVLSVWMKATVLWFVILAAAILNGVLREQVLVPAAGPVGGLMASGLILSTFIFLTALAAVPWYGRLASSQWLRLGLFWLMLTVVFEFSFGRFIQHNTWRELLQAYTFQGGNIWPLVLAATLVSPWVAARLRGRIQARSVQPGRAGRR